MKIEEVKEYLLILSEKDFDDLQVLVDWVKKNYQMDRFTGMYDGNPEGMYIIARRFWDEIKASNLGKVLKKYGVKGVD